MQTTYEQISDRPQSLGALADGGLSDILSAVNSSPGAAQVDTVTITNYVAAKTLTWTIDGVAFSYAMTVADADVTGVAHSITLQLQAEPIFGGRFYATHLLGVITLTARFPGVGWTILATGTWAADFTVANITANAAGAALPYGRLAISDGLISGTSQKKVKVASAANCTARLVSLTPSHEDLTLFGIDITFNGQTYRAQYDSTAGHTVANIVAALVAAVNLMMPASSVIASDEGTTHLHLLAEVAGQTFEYVAWVSGATATWTATDTALESDDVSKAAVGIALRSDSIETNSDTVPGYPANRACSILRAGRVVVQTSTLIDVTKKVYVRMASATTLSPLGSFDDDSGSGLVLLDPTRFRWVRAAAATRAVLQIAC